MAAPTNFEMKYKRWENLLLHHLYVATDHERSFCDINKCFKLRWWTSNRIQTSVQLLIAFFSERCQVWSGMWFLGFTTGILAIKRRKTNNIVNLGGSLFLWTENLKKQCETIEKGVFAVLCTLSTWCGGAGGNTRNAGSDTSTNDHHNLNSARVKHTSIRAIPPGHA